MIAMSTTADPRRDTAPPDDTDPERLYLRLNTALEEYQARTAQMQTAEAHGEATNAMDLREERMPVAEEAVELMLALDAALRDRRRVPFVWRVPSWRRWLRRFAA